MAAAVHNRFKRAAGSHTPYGFAGATGTIMHDVPLTTLPPSVLASPTMKMRASQDAHESREAIFTSFITHLGASRADTRVLLVAEGTGQHADHLVKRAPWLFVVPAASSPEALESIEAHRARMPPALRARVDPAALLDHDAAGLDEWAALRGGAAGSAMAAAAGFDAVLASHAFDDGADPAALLAGAAAALRTGGRLFLWEGVSGGDGDMEPEWRGPELVALGAGVGLAAVAVDGRSSGSSGAARGGGASSEAMLVFERAT